MSQDSNPKFRILPSPSTKVHQIRYVPVLENEYDTNDVLAVSTEDGRVLFYFTDSSSTVPNGEETKREVELLQPVAYFGGASDGLTGRIKDFEILRLSGSAAVLIVTCSSDGAIRLWLVEDAELKEIDKNRNGNTDQQLNGSSDKVRATGHYTAPPQPIGQLIGLYESKHRITCLATFLMSGPIEHEASGLQNGGASAFDEEDGETIEI